jgi:hypothetical protein
MKNSSTQSLKSRSNPSQKNPDESSLPGHLFLGHKLLAELRILMRLSAGAVADGASLKESAGHTF